MEQSKCTLWPRLPLWCILNIRQFEFHRITILTRSVILFCVFETAPFLMFVGLVFLFFVAPSLAVFYEAKVFNQDVSKWNTGAVTTMQNSKCTLSPSLCGHAFRCCVFEYDNSSFIESQFSHVLLFCFCVFETVPFLLFVVGWSFFSLLHPLLLQCLLTHLRSIRTCPTGIRAR